MNGSTNMPLMHVESKVDIFRSGIPSEICNSLGKQMSDGCIWYILVFVFVFVMRLCEICLYKFEVY